MSIGYACICIGDYMRMKGLRLADASPCRLDQTYAHNLGVLASNIMYNRDHGIRLFRVSSDILPLVTHEGVCFDWKKRFAEELSEIKGLIAAAGIRVSMHPGQYTVLNSLDRSSVRKAVAEIDHHSEFLSFITDDAYAPVVVHMGASGGCRTSSAARFRENFKKLSDGSKKRLCIENDEKAFGAKDVYDTACELGIRCIYDVLHDKVNPSFDLSEKEIISLFSKTFSGRRQKIHYSQQASGRKQGAHSLTIGHEEFVRFYEDIGGESLDIMLEVKDKDLSCVKCMNCVGGDIDARYPEWARYKYFVMERDTGIYRNISALMPRDAFSYAAFYDLVEKAVFTKEDRGGSVNAMEHVWGYFKKRADESEKEKYKRYIGMFGNGRIRAGTIKKFLLSLAVKYDVGYLKKSIYFFSETYSQ